MSADAGPGLVAGIDFLSGGVATVIAREKADGIEILGCGFAPIAGLQGDATVDVPERGRAIRESVTIASERAGAPIARVVVGLPGCKVMSFTSHAAITIKDKSAVSEDDIHRVSQLVAAVEVPTGNEVMQVIYQRFEIDDTEGVEDPIGMVATRLVLKALVLANAESPRRSWAMWIEEAGLPHPSFALSSLASCEAILTSGERERGVVLLDLQDEGVDLVIFQKGRLVLRKHLRLPGGVERARLEELLSVNLSDDGLSYEGRRQGAGRRKGVDWEEVIPTIFRLGQPPIVRRTLVQRVEACTDNLLRRIDDELDDPDFKDRFKTSIALTGDVTNMPGLDRLLETCFGVSVRRPVGLAPEFPGEVENLPVYLRAKGLALWGIRNALQVLNA